MELDFIYCDFDIMCYCLLRQLNKRSNIIINDLEIYLDLEPEEHDSYGFYDKKRKCIKLNLNDFKRYIYDEEEFRKELQGRGFDFLLAHELGHYVHDTYFNFKKIEIKNENKIFNFHKTKEENFADCFADWLINSKDTLERNKEMEDILLEEGLLNIKEE